MYWNCVLLVAIDPHCPPEGTLAVQHTITFFIFASNLPGNMCTRNTPPLRANARPSGPALLASLTRIVLDLRRLPASHSAIPSVHFSTSSDCTLPGTCHLLHVTCHLILDTCHLILDTWTWVLKYLSAHIAQKNQSWEQLCAVGKNYGGGHCYKLEFHASDVGT